jgi:hypothetical protein
LIVASRLIVAGSAANVTKSYTIGAPIFDYSNSKFACFRTVILVTKYVSKKPKLGAIFCNQSYSSKPWRICMHVIKIGTKIWNGTQIMCNFVTLAALLYMARIV